MGLVSVVEIYTTKARLWIDIYEIFRDTAAKHGLVLSDLLSLVLLEAGLNPTIVFAAVLRGFDVNYDVACQVASEVHDRIIDLLEVLCKAKESSEEAVRVEKA